MKKSASKKAILIKTPNKKEYLLRAVHLPHIIEFAKTFSAEIYQVKVDDPSSILSLEEFPKALCDSRYQIKGKFKEKKQILPVNEIASKKNEMPFPPLIAELTRAEKIARGNMIKSFVRNRLLQKFSVEWQMLKEEFADIQSPTIKYWTKKAIDNLKNEGYTIVNNKSNKSYKIDPFPEPTAAPVQWHTFTLGIPNTNQQYITLHGNQGPTTITFELEPLPTTPINQIQVNPN